MWPTWPSPVALYATLSDHHLHLHSARYITVYPASTGPHGDFVLRLVGPLTSHHQWLCRHRVSSAGQFIHYSVWLGVICQTPTTVRASLIIAISQRAIGVTAGCVDVLAFVFVCGPRQMASAIIRRYLNSASIRSVPNEQQTTMPCNPTDGPLWLFSLATAPKSCKCVPSRFLVLGIFCSLAANVHLVCISTHIVAWLAPFLTQLILAEHFIYLLFGCLKLNLIAIQININYICRPSTTLNSLLVRV